ncbi:MAG: choice-of-anchor J domain-containing protein [Bacteroidales bacterium]|nr:choice-of-anchor J domain-containing protein [Bacteroidales bacterium]
MKKILLLVVAFTMSISLFAQDFTEDFSSVTADENVTLDGWNNVALEGTRVFIGKYYAADDNSYAQMSAYNAGEASEVVYMVTPGLNVNSSVLTFDSKLAYMVHDPASVKISTNYSGNASTATWTDLTYTHATAPEDGYGDWVASGNIDLSAYNGQTVYIAFVYEGGDPGETTTLQIDNVTVTNAAVGINETAANNVSIYPNPTTNFINISENADVVVYTISGQQVLSVNNTKSVNVSNLQAGVYFANITTVNGVSVEKFIIK